MPLSRQLAAAIVIEVVLAFIFVPVIHGATDGRAPAGLAPLAIGLTLALIHLISIPVTNTSVNPARSLGPAVFAGGWALEQLWVFIVFPIVGGALGGLVYRALFEEKKQAG
jgi:aquaporin Z